MQPATRLHAMAVKAPGQIQEILTYGFFLGKKDLQLLGAVLVIYFFAQTLLAGAGYGHDRVGRRVRDLDDTERVFQLTEAAGTGGDRGPDPGVPERAQHARHACAGAAGTPGRPEDAITVLEMGCCLRSLGADPVRWRQLGVQGRSLRFRRAGRVCDCCRVGDAGVHHTGGNRNEKERGKAARNARLRHAKCKPYLNQSSRNLRISP